MAYSFLNGKRRKGDFVHQPAVREDMHALLGWSTRSRLTYPAELYARSMPLRLKWQTRGPCRTFDILNDVHAMPCTETFHRKRFMPARPCVKCDASLDKPLHPRCSRSWRRRRAVVTFSSQVQELGRARSWRLGVARVGSTNLLIQTG